MVESKWIIIDADGISLGRVASFAAIRLMGKYKSDWTPYADNGDFVVIVNSLKAKLTGRKKTDKEYHFHSGYPGGLKTFSYRDMIKKDPTYPIFQAIKGMLPKNKLSNAVLKKVKIYPDENHPHLAQQPVRVEIKK
ncbi:50S ribosomal protein L13 [Candidatus Acidulodesulfobacterium sp. H_13]|uniref:50S ribosomal protein L13 n=1 Tax=Candidatus Acidulodesulfobacterium sp. H_13 TaxID=3395470 RepID=UPI003AF7F4B1